jgi:hypothetical protein
MVVVGILPGRPRIRRAEVQVAADAVAVGVVERIVGAGVAGVAVAVMIGVGLHGIGDRRTVVAQISVPVGVGIGL